MISHARCFSTTGAASQSVEQCLRRWAAVVFYALHVTGQNRFSRACIGALRRQHAGRASGGGVFHRAPKQSSTALRVWPGVNGVLGSV